MPSAPSQLPIPPAPETLARLAGAMALVRDLAATPAMGTRRVRRLLIEMRDAFEATAAATQVTAGGVGDDAVDLVKVDWSDAADAARAAHRDDRAGGGPFLRDVLPLDEGRVARLELFRRCGRPFNAADAAWLNALHAGCAFAYAVAADVRPASATRTIERLSPRDRQTLELLLVGASEKQIAARIGRSPHTVHTRVKRIYRQFGVTSRGELLARCLNDVDDAAPSA